MKMRSCVVAIAKYENDYIREWIEYNLNLGFDHIFIGDNNDDHIEDIFTVVNDYVKDGKVTIINIKDYNITQNQFYHHVYKNLVGSFDWVLFYDIDEFLVLNKHKTVNEYLSQEKFNDFDIIKINWKVMSNNGYVVQIDKPVLERFTKEGNNYIISYNKDSIIYANNTIKSLYRTNLDLMPAVHCIENPKYDNIFKYCDNTGKEIVNKPDFPNWSLYNDYINYDDAYIKHFITKSLEEYVKYKVKRGWSCFKDPKYVQKILNENLNITNFEDVNGKSILYEKMFDEILIKYGLKNKKDSN